MRHFKCPQCGRLTSSEFTDAVWCLHYDSNFQYHPPAWVENDWMRMLPVTNVFTGVNPPEADHWYVIEHQNPYGNPDGSNTYVDGDWSQRVVAGPFAREEAYADAEARPRREGWEPHTHGFRVLPGDLLPKEGD